MSDLLNQSLKNWPCGTRCKKDIQHFSLTIILLLISYESFNWIRALSLLKTKQYIFISTFCCWCCSTDFNGDTTILWVTEKFSIPTVSLQGHLWYRLLCTGMILNFAPLLWRAWTFLLSGVMLKPIKEHVIPYFSRYIMGSWTIIILPSTADGPYCMDYIWNGIYDFDLCVDTILDQSQYCHQLSP